MFSALIARDRLTVCAGRDAGAAYTTEERLDPARSNRSKPSKNQEPAQRLQAQRPGPTSPPTEGNLGGWR